MDINALVGVFHYLILLVLGAIGLILFVVVTFCKRRK